MNNYDLSILIPARNEMFLVNTVQNILENIEGNTEIIVVLDGAWADPMVPQNERVTIIYNNESVGQRAATNQACRLSKAKYVMKVDAHCAFDKGFDVKMIKEMHDDWTMVPTMRNLHAFDWVCAQGHRRYQGPSGPCEKCGKETKRDILWRAKDSPNSVSYCFDSTPHFQYFGEYSKRPEGQGDVTETMSLQGSCWMLTRDKYWELDVCDENFGSWGSQGIEVAAKTWLSGGAVMVNKKTWYGHMFRTQGGDFGFPYPISGRQTENAKKFAKDLFFNDKWPKQVRPLSWLVERFWPVKGWSDEDLAKLKTNTFEFKDKSLENKPEESEPTEGLPENGIIYSSSNEESIKKNPTKGIIYYTDNELDEKIAKPCRESVIAAAKTHNFPIVTSALHKRLDFGVKNIYFPSLKKSYESMFKQILCALENSTSDIIFFTEADVLYHTNHFGFTPERGTFYYNQNVWYLRCSDGFCLHYDVNQLSGLCGWRDELITHFKERLEYIEKNGFPRSKMGFEPMTHNRIDWKNKFKLGTWKSKAPNVDIRHGSNPTGNRWTKDKFRNQHLLINWTEAWEIPSWGLGTDLIKILT